MKQSPISRTLRQFFEATTLHGFKYFNAPIKIDRLCWLLGCCASTCCAVLLTAVLWTRFRQVPALLTMRFAESVPQPLPMVGVCLPANRVAHSFMSNFTVNPKKAKKLTNALARVIQGKITMNAQIFLLEQFLITNNLTLSKALLNLTPPCRDLTTKCRFNNMMMPCEKLFRKELTQWGICCIAHPARLKKREKRAFGPETSKRMTLVLQCSNGSILYGCEFLTRYEGEDWIQPVLLTPGLDYMALLRYITVQDRDTEKLVSGLCESDDGYLRSKCLMKCVEHFCGCSDPLQKTDDNRNPLPPCSMPRLNCLRDIKPDTLSCNCLPSCKKINTIMSLSSSPMNAINNTFDPIYTGLNVTSSVVINLYIRVELSRIFTRNPTESWLTLLSSLGGVFNMFLGVGLFSVLEFLFLILVQLPIALKRSLDMNTHVTIIK